MTTLSIELPDRLVETSQTLAQQQGISYADFIRQAIINEIEKYHQLRLTENQQLDSTPTQPTFANKWVGQFKLEQGHFEEAHFEYLKEKYHL